MASTATDVDPAHGIWCHKSAVDPARAHWAPRDRNAIIRVSVPVGSVTTGSGARDVPKVTMVIRGVVLVAVTSPARHSARMVSANAMTRDSVLARYKRSKIYQFI